MRIAVVSSHYPPDFVSGGTLVAQRLAQGFHRRGHDVAVFAGWLGLEAATPPAPLSTWDEVDDAGVPVRWVAVGPFIGWDDRRNFENPGAEAAFAVWLREHHPDVVHLHSLQAMGAGMVEVAAASGAKVVVTMHDFWWTCARQFLVDRQDHPCSLVVDAGGCACQVDRAWLEERNQRLRQALGCADLVLAPSATAASVLAANGVAPERLAVDENGVDRPTEVTIRRPAGADVVRFRYAGGWNPMKGAPILLRAFELLAERRPSGWTATTHGIPQPGTPAPAVPAVVTLAEPYPPEALEAVLADTDVLVLPSVMRETHSILTREALLRGVPVITSDSLGPEEVVRDGRNGLVVPADDAELLALAMQRVLDPAVLAALRAGCGTLPPLRVLDQQIDGLLERYEALGPPPPRPAPRHVVWMSGITGAPLRYRARLPAEAVELLGCSTEVLHYRDDRLPDAIARADVVVVYRVPSTQQVLALIAAARQAGTPVLFDVDDLIFDPGIEAEIPALRILPPAERELWLEGVRRYRETMEACDGYIGSTEMLVEHARTTVGLPAARFDNGVGLVLARRSDAAVARPRRPGPLRIGYLSGTTTHDEDWRYVEPAVAAVLDARPEVELWLGGHLPPSGLDARFGARVRRIPFTAWTELPEVLRDLDVNLAPLAPGSRFNEAKSAIKWLEAALTETVTVASPTAPFREAIVDGVNGRLASSVDDWEAAITTLVDDPLLRRRLGSRARRDALLGWSPHLQGRRYLAILDEAAAWRAARLPRPAADSRFDEPLVAGDPLDPYAEGADQARPGMAASVAVGAAPRRRLARRVAGRLRRYMRRARAAVSRGGEPSG